jgi:hypothetical protein
MSRTRLHALGMRLAGIAGGVLALLVIARAHGGPAQDAGTSPPDGLVPDPAPKVTRKNTKTARFRYEDASGTQTMVVSFLPKHRIALTITRERTDGCRFSKKLTARFDDVQGLGLPDGDDTQVDEYIVEPHQMSCPFFIDIEKETMALAEVTTTACGAACKLEGRALMRLKAD